MLPDDVVDAHKLKLASLKHPDMVTRLYYCGGADRPQRMLNILKTGFYTAGTSSTFLFLSRTLLPLVLSGYTIGSLSFTQLFTSVTGIPISLYDLGTSTSCISYYTGNCFFYRFHGRRLWRRIILLKVPFESCRVFCGK